MMKRHRSLIEHLVAFSGYLRCKNYSVGIEETRTALMCIDHIDLGTFDDFIHMLQICFAKSQAEWETILDHFKNFQKEYQKDVDAKVSKKKIIQDGQKGGKEKKYQLEDIKKWLFSLELKDQVETAFYSPYSSDDKLFFDFEKKDLEVLDFWLKKMVQKLAVDRRRKKKKNKTRGDLDLRHLIQNRFSKGDELIQLYYRYPKKERSKIVLLCDVSKSMDLYSRFITSLMKQLPKIFNSVAIYYFNTDLYDIRSLDEVRDVPGLWAGGTRIGYCFDKWLEKVPSWFDQQTIILIYSDGWDTGDLNLLRQSMYSMQKMSRKVIWMNPVIKDSNDLEIAGMRVASQYVDLLAPVYNLKTLKAFVRNI